MSTSSSSNSVDANEFTGMRVLVTGGTKGAGKAIADWFLRGGATAAITARSVPGDKTAAHFIQADVSTAEGATKVISEILNHFHAIDVVIHNVGGSSAPSGGFMTVTDEIWQQNLNENLFPAVRLDRGLLPSMHDRTGFRGRQSRDQAVENRCFNEVSLCEPAFCGRAKQRKDGCDQPTRRKFPRQSC
jgi:NAD(P)-dependent dehydrogenase (short-subunit alcohol dehydrogenase family)